MRLERPITVILVAPQGMLWIELAADTMHEGYRYLPCTQLSRNLPYLSECSSAVLKRAAKIRRRPSGQVVAIVRGGSDMAAAERLREGFDSGDAELLRSFDDLAGQDRLVTYAGA